MLLLVLLALLTGGLHLDGFMDTCDGLFSLRAPEERLAIFRDSRVGSFGVVGAATLLLLQWTALGALPPGSARPCCSSRWQWRAGRWFTPSSPSPTGRPTGLGRVFKEQASGRALSAATLGLRGRRRCCYWESPG